MKPSSVEPLAAQGGVRAQVLAEDGSQPVGVVAVVEPIAQSGPAEHLGALLDVEAQQLLDRHARDSPAAMIAPVLVPPT